MVPAVPSAFLKLAVQVPAAAAFGVVETGPSTQNHVVFPVLSAYPVAQIVFANY